MMRIKQFILLVLIGICLTATAFKPTDENLIIGQWEEESGVRIIQIYKSGNLFFGKILKNEHQENDQLTVGKVFMQNFEYNADDGIWEGKVNLPAKDMTLRTEIELKNPNQIESIAHWGIFKKSKIWKRINSSKE